MVAMATLLVTSPSCRQVIAILSGCAMKLRRIGNSLGTTFGKALLERAGFKEDDQLDIQAVPGEIQIRRASNRLVVELTQSEANALAEGNTKSRAWKSAMEKVRMKAKVQ